MAKTTLSRKYIILSILYGLSTLIVPLASQYLVNSLALSSIFSNTIIFLVIVVILLSAAQALRFAQVVILEFIQREIFIAEARRWALPVSPEKAHYMLEIQNLMKNFSAAYGHLVELGLTLFFGFLLIVSFHPMYLLLPLISGAAFWAIILRWKEAVETSVEESTVKYALIEEVVSGSGPGDDDLTTFLQARDQHFAFVKHATVLVGIAFVLSQLFLLGSGIYLIESGGLSVGQLVSAEIVLTGIMVTVGKLPKMMESLYDLETSKIKLEVATGGPDEK